MMNEEIKKIIGYLVIKGEDVIAATGNEREALYYAREYAGISYKVTTTIGSKSGYLGTVREQVYDGTI